jgi:hypothetical protein
LPEKPGSTRPGAAKLSTLASFTLVRTCVPALFLCSCISTFLRGHFCSDGSV